jgi:hypothetical protein
MHAKILGLLTATAIASMALAAGAMATTLTTSAGETPTFHATSEGHAVLHNPIASIQCGSTIQGTVTSHGAGVDVVTPLSSLVFSNCTNSWHVTTVSAGQTTLKWIAADEGTLSSDGVTVESTRFGTACRYATSNTDIGTLTDSSKTGGHATIHIAASIPFHGGSALCGTGATKWTGAYTVSTPATMNIDE